MKNFLDLLAIDTNILVAITISSINDNGSPWAWIKVNDRMLYQDYLSGTCSRLIPIDITDSITIEIGMDQKIYSAERETAVVIDRIMLDDFAVVPRYSHLATYENERNQDTPTNYLGINGRWILDTKEPFYRWRHRVTGQGWLLDPVKTVVRGSSGNV